MRGTVCLKEIQGFTLAETVVALGILVFGLLAAGQMLFVAASSSSLARSKDTAAIAAQDRLEALGALYQQNPLADDLTTGSHGPRQSEITDPAGASPLNCFRVAWDVSIVPDPRPGKRLDAKLVTVTVSPSLPDGTVNSKPGLNKILNVATILSPVTR